MFQFNNNVNLKQTQDDDSLPTFEELIGDKELFKVNTSEENKSENIQFNTPDIISDDKYSLIREGIELGYYLVREKGDVQISNFYMSLKKWVKAVRDGEPLSYYEGDIFFNDNTSVKIDRMTASTLEDPSTFRKYIGNLCGPKAMIYGSPSDVAKAIKTFSKDVQRFEEEEFGYNESLNTYYTEDLIITADTITDTKTPIKYSDRWGNNKLGFKNGSEHQAEKVKEFIINKFMIWDDPKIIYNELAFAFLPLIYPFLKHKNPNKFYLMIKGASGSGKSQMSKWIQSFYGNFQSLLAWTSTDTSINIVGSAFKDSIFAVDDLKLQNFRSDSDAKKIMMTLQNYCDGTGRQRANVDLKLRDERIIKGHLLISAEDLVISEASTIARGIIINVYSKPVMLDKLSEITEASLDFSFFTPYLIQYILKNYDQNLIGQFFENSHRFISSHPLINDPNISPDNLPRLINNFATLRTSWLILSSFLFENKSDTEIDNYNKIFDQNLISLLLENIERISKYKPDAIFEQSLWEFIENGTFRLKKVLRNGEYESLYNNERGKAVGSYIIDDSGEINLVIMLPTALSEMKKMIENFAISEDTLKSKLLLEKKIKINPSNKFSLYGKKVTGVQWVGSIPKSIFGLIEENDPLEQVDKILAYSPTDDNHGDIIF